MKMAIAAALADVQPRLNEVLEAYEPRQLKWRIVPTSTQRLDASLASELRPEV